MLFDNPMTVTLNLETLSIKTSNQQSMLYTCICTANYIHIQLKTIKDMR